MRRENSGTSNAVMVFGPPLLFFALIAGGLEISIRAGVIKEYLLPTPSSVLLSLIEDWEEYREGMISTGVASAIGLVLSFGVGSLVAVVLSISRFARRSFLPYAVFFQTVPVVAVAPLLVIWFGFGQPTVIASSFIVSIFPIVVNTLGGLDSTDRALEDLFRLYGASGRQRIFLLKVPFALPQVLAGMKVAAGLAVIGAIVGEFIGGGGLGSVVDVARTQQRVDKVFAAVLLSSAIGLIYIALLSFVGRLTMGRWHASAMSGKD